ncbi:Uncharacterized protein HZ326_19730 [Fusarium oxysporum f. sp. albedinis]|nr:Uncharacterized protein HZ326_19730 [Fusarium oxysporum f. sp. albedinis]
MPKASKTIHVSERIHQRTQQSITQEDIQKASDHHLINGCRVPCEASSAVRMCTSLPASPPCCSPRHSK